jgi:DNA repair exonuclease SbcCD ATPase subunit
VDTYQPPQREPQPTVDELAAESDRAAGAEQDAVQALRDIEAAMSAVAPVAATYDAAWTECDRLRRLDTVFTTTIARLEAARAAMYHNVQAELEFHLRDWLGDVTGGRYTSVRIDPESLSVFIAGPDDPEVDAFEDSQGTSELVQLLLRLALFMRARGSERGPLILDDVLAHLDPERAAAMVGILAKIARQKHQVILFTTHEPAAGVQTIRLISTRDDPTMPDAQRPAVALG